MGNRSKKSQGVEQQAFFATQQRRLLNQLKQQMSAKESRSDEVNETPQSRNSTESSSARQIPRVTLRNTLRDTFKAGKPKNDAQTSAPKSALRKGKGNSERGNGGHQEKDMPGIQRKQEEGGSTLIESDDDLQLNAPPPKNSITTVEGLSELLFSNDHLKYIIQDQVLYTRFSLFLARYRPQLVPILHHYIEIQKAMKALEYANAVASSLGPIPGESDLQGIQTAFATNEEMDERQHRVVDLLLNEALPAQINFGIVDVVTDVMQKAIRGSGNRQTPILRNLIGGLSEVFTLTDPSIEDNPIIYASDEFYNMTGYGRDFVIGRNCRFLQGPRTNHHSVRRLKTSIDSGIEISETLLNYRRDGTPFVNLLMVAPLHDNKGNIRYYIGAQVDVTGLVEQGQGLEGFEAFLNIRKRQDVLKRHGAREERSLPLQKLAELSEMFDVTENAIVRSRSRSNSLTRDSGYGSNYQSGVNGRRIIIEDSPSDEEGDDGDEVRSQVTDSAENKLKWKLAPPGVATGLLPGVYQKYLLLRPAPSLKVIFLSPGLRKLAKLSKRGFLDYVEGSKGTMKGLKEAFESGVPVSANVRWNYDDSNNSAQGKKKDTGKPKRDTWISATPMLGSDDSIGVWIVVVVQESDTTNSGREDSIQSMPTTSNSDVKQQLLGTEAQMPSDGNIKSIASDAETNTNKHQERPSTSSMSATQQPPQPRTSQLRPKSAPISSLSNTSDVNGASTTAKRNSAHIYSFSQTIPYPPPDSNDESPIDNNEDLTTQQLTPSNTRMSGSNLVQNPHLENVFFNNTSELPPLQDSDGIERRKNFSEKGKGESGGAKTSTERIRIAYTSEDEEGDKRDKEEEDGEEDDSGVDTVEEDNGDEGDKEKSGLVGGSGNSGMETPPGKIRVAVEEKWTPPMKNIWVKPPTPRPTLPDRMMSID